MIRPLFVLVAIAVTPCFQQCLTPNDAQSQPRQDDRRVLYLGQQNFSLSMLRELSRASPKQNVFFSPYSTYHALLLAYFGAANQTESSLKTLLQIPHSQDKVATMQAYRLDRMLRNITPSEGSYELRSANKIYVSDRISLRSCMKSLFDTEVENVDIFSDPNKAKEMINSWVESETRGEIKDLIPQLDRESNMVLVNAAYFKGLWQSEFQAANTRKEVFHISSEERTLVPMMKQKGTFNYLSSERLGAHVLELPYKGEAISMFILLPPFIKSNVEAVIKRLDAQTLQEILEQDALAPQTVEVELPKFSVETSQDITHVLESMGAGDAFQDSADFSVFTGARDVLFDTVMHKAKIEVDEKGTKAAAATAMFLFRSARPLNPNKFLCNHPFVYLLFDRLSQSVLFAGIYRTPHN